jgi:hypothetical protein
MGTVLMLATLLAYKRGRMLACYKWRSKGGLHARLARMPLSNTFTHESVGNCEFHIR